MKDFAFRLKFLLSDSTLTLQVADVFFTYRTSVKFCVLATKLIELAVVTFAQ